MDTTPRRRRTGLTLVEILIVVVVLGVLAAIAVVRFGPVRAHAHEELVRNDLRNIGLGQEHRHLREGAYTAAPLDSLPALVLSPHVRISGAAATASHWAAVGTTDEMPGFCAAMGGSGFGAVRLSCVREATVEVGISNTDPAPGEVVTLDLTGAVATLAAADDRPGLWGPAPLAAQVGTARAALQLVAWDAGAGEHGGGDPRDPGSLRPSVVYGGLPIKVALVGRDGTLHLARLVEGVGAGPEPGPGPGPGAGTPQPPTARISIRPGTPVAGVPAILDGSASTDPDNRIVSWAWQIGAASRSTMRANYPFATAGSETVRLIVTDESGLADTAVTTVTVAAANQPPVARITAPERELTIRRLTELSASASSDADGSIVSWRWDFGDNSADGTSETVHKRYTAPGLYRVRLIVTDDAGQIGQDEVTLSVIDNVAPIARISATPLVAPTGTTVTFDGSGSTDADGHIQSHEWLFHDEGAPRAGATTSRTFTTPGVFWVRLRVTDDLWDVGEDSVQVTAENRAPVVGSFSCTPVATGATTTCRATGFTDPDGGVLEYQFSMAPSGAGQDPAFTGSWQSGWAWTRSFSRPGLYNIYVLVRDGQGGEVLANTTLNVANRPPTAPAVACSPTTAQPTGSTVTCVATGSTDPDGGVIGYSWSTLGLTGPLTGPTTTYSLATPGTVPVLATATDGQGGATASVPVTLTFTNRPPQLTSIVLSADGATTMSRTVTTEVNTSGWVPSASLSATTLSVQSNTPITLTSTGSDPEGGALTWYLTWSGPGGGASDTEYTSSPMRTYTPTRPGGWTLHVHARDPHDGRVRATIPFTVTNRPPTTPVVSCTATTNPTLTPVTCTASGGTDSDGGTVTYTWSTADRTGAATGATTTFQRNRSGTTVVTVTAADGQGGSTTSTPVTLTFTNRPPVVGTPTTSPLTVPSGTTVTWTVPTSDADGTIARWRWHLYMNSPRNQFYAGHNDYPSGSFSYTFNEPGTYVIYAGAQDDQGAWGAGTRGDGWSPSTTVTVTNRPPETGSVSCSPTSVPSGTSFTCTASGWHDLDGGSLTYEFHLHTANGATLLETRSSATGSVTFTRNVPGAVAAWVRVRDDQGSGWVGWVKSNDVTVTNRPPTVGTVSCSPTTVNINQAFTCTASDWSDPDGGTLTYEFHMHRGDGAVWYDSRTTTSPSASFSWSAPGTVAVWVRVYDNQGSGYVGWPKSNVVTIVDPNRPPVRTSYGCSPTTAHRGQAITCTDSWSDPDGDAVRHNFVVYNSGWALIHDSGDIASASWAWSTSTLGTYYVYAQARDARTGWIGWGQISTVHVINRPPNVPTFTCPVTYVQTGNGANCDIGSVSDPDGDPVTYTWSANWREAAYPGTTSGHHWTWYMRDRGNPGYVYVTVTATDSHGAQTTSATTSIYFWDNRVPRPGTVSCTAAASGTRRINCTTSGWWDPDGHAITHYGWVLFNSGWAAVATQTTSVPSVAWTGLVAGQQYIVTMNGRDAAYQHTDDYWITLGYWVTAR